MNELDIIKNQNFTFNKNYGQNFIFDHNLLKAIVGDAQVEKCQVLEIGPGAGTLTKNIAQVADKVVCYEIDKNLQPVLSQSLENVNNVNVIYQDVLKADIKDIESNFDGEYIMVANLPYYITTPIIFKFLENATRLKRLIIMVQLEVANRLCAKENTADYGAITAAIGYRADSKITRVVKRQMFVPAPNVDSAIVRIDFNKDKYQIDNTKILDQVIKASFAMRRKTLNNNLKKSLNLSSEYISTMFDKLNLPASIRGEACNISDLVNIANYINQNK